MNLKNGDRVIATRVGPNAVVVRDQGRSPYVLLEVDEPLPYLGLPNPRRKILAHESWVERVLDASTSG
jgi:hypothetical protein